MEALDTLVPVVQGLQLAMFGYFLWMQKQQIGKLDMLGEKISGVRESFTKLKTEHDMYKDMNDCPLVRGSKHK